MQTLVTLLAMTGGGAASAPPPTFPEHPRPIRLQRSSQLPPLRPLQEAATRLQLGAVGALTTRARWSAFLPRFRVSLGTKADLDVRANDLRRTTTEARAFGFDITAEWQLRELVFGDTDLRLEQERARRAASARAVAERVAELYFAWLRVDASTASDASLQAAEIEGRLDALTGGLVTSARSARFARPDRPSGTEAQR